MLASRAVSALAGSPVAAAPVINAHSCGSAASSSSARSCARTRWCVEREPERVGGGLAGLLAAHGAAPRDPLVDRERVRQLHGPVDDPHPALVQLAQLDVPQAAVADGDAPDTGEAQPAHGADAVHAELGADGRVGVVADATVGSGGVDAGVEVEQRRAARVQQRKRGEVVDAAHTRDRDPGR